jgi:hypothetical protein
MGSLFENGRPELVAGFVNGPDQTVTWPAVRTVTQLIAPFGIERGCFPSQPTESPNENVSQLSRMLMVVLHVLNVFQMFSISTIAKCR